MRSWSLGSTDPLNLTLSSDFRLSTPDYLNDHIWELDFDSGDPPAVSLRTTFGLRAKLMRLFPRFHRSEQVISAPSAFAAPPRLRFFTPNFLQLDFSPFQGLDSISEYWIPDSHTAASRITLTNTSSQPTSFLLELCAQLVPMEGQPLAAVQMQSVDVLAGDCADLAPVLFLSGGPHHGKSSFPSLVLNLSLPAGTTRTFTWVLASLASPNESFQHARLTASRPWDAERSRLEMVNAADTVEIFTGDPAWDAALAFSQKTAFSLFFGPSAHLPQPSFVTTRQPVQGWASHGPESVREPFWSGQTAFEALYLANVLPGAPHLTAGLLQNFLSTSSPDGHVDCKPGLAGQRGRWLAPPLLAGLAWHYASRTADDAFLAQVYPQLKTHLKQWFSPAHDRDEDGFPEWDHVLQTGFEDHPLYSPWLASSQACEITCTESPGLLAMLYHDLQALTLIADTLHLLQDAEDYRTTSANLHAHLEMCWEPLSGRYCVRDRDSHLSPVGRQVAKQVGPGTLESNCSSDQPLRLLIQVQFKGNTPRHPQVTLLGQRSGQACSETLSRDDFQWASGRATATTRTLFTHLETVQVSGLQKSDRLTLRILDLSVDDLTAYLPLWAGIPAAARVATLVANALLNPKRYGRTYGLPAWPAQGASAPPESFAVHLPWNVLIGQGLLAHGYRAQAADLLTRLMSAVIGNLKRQHSFSYSYHATTGAGQGERNALNGLAPVAFFLQTLGLEIHSPHRLILSGMNPYPWPVTVKYRGLTVIRHLETTEVVFPNGQATTHPDTAETHISIDQG